MSRAPERSAWLVRLSFITYPYHLMMQTLFWANGPFR